jgi:GNAT superfamily N-acetyltransferase
MSLKQNSTPMVSIYPLTFLQIAQSSSAVVNALQEQDIQAQNWFGTSPLVKRFMIATGVPLYYHWLTSGYGAFLDHEIAGWLFLRGWHQVLYVEGLAVAPDWRRKGVATALMHFVEQQAHELRREWLGLTVTLANESAVSLYEQQGFQRGHARILCYQGQDVPDLPESSADLSSVIAQTAGQMYRHFAERDLAAGNAPTSQVQARFLGRESYRSISGNHWLVRIDGQPAAYLHRRRFAQRLVIYLAALPEHWASPELIGALAKAVGKTKPSPTIELRLASDGHHDAMCAAMGPLGFVERLATTMKMFKHLV